MHDEKQPAPDLAEGVVSMLPAFEAVGDDERKRIGEHLFGERKVQTVLSDVLPVLVRVPFEGTSSVYAN